MLHLYASTFGLSTHPVQSCQRTSRRPVWGLSRHLLTGGIVLFLLFSPMLGLAQTIRYVTPMGTQSVSTATSWTTSTSDLQGAINASGPGDQVWIAAGVYKPTTGTDQTISFAMKNGVAIYGGFVGNETVLSQRPRVNPISGSPSSTTLSGDIGTPGTNSDNTYHVISNPQDLTMTALLDGVVITGGNTANGSGGGMYNQSGSPVLTNCLFQGNTANSSGGGMYNEVGSPVLTNCLFQSNTAFVGFGGGGMYNQNGSPVLTNCSFQSNTVSNNGGGMFNRGGSPVLTNCSFQGNTARNSSGGGMFNQSSSPILTNCSFQGNTANASGGGMFNGIGSPVLTNCSFQGNTASNGGGIANNGGSPILTNCVLFGNGGANAISNSSEASLKASYCLFDASTTNYTDQDHNLTTTTSPFASTTTVALNACAPAINAGSNTAYTAASGPATDLEGQARFYNNGTIDMGAIEYQGVSNRTGFTAQPVASSVVCVGSTVSVPVSVSGTGTLTYQWIKGGSTVNGQTTAMLSLTNLQTGDAGNYSVEVTGACNSVTSTTFSLTVNAIPIVSINPTSATLTSASPAVSLTAIGSGTYRWSTGETSQVISVTSSGVYSVSLTSPGGCSASTTASVPGADLTVSLELPQTQFGASGTAAVGNFVVNVFEVGGLATSSGNVTITITAPVGYTLSFSPNLPSIDVSGGSKVEVNNEQWQQINDLDGRQLTFRMSSGSFINGGSKSSMGLSITRTTANSGSTSSITVAVADDLTMRYDGNLINNVYARIISGL